MLLLGLLGVNVWCRRLIDLRRTCYALEDILYDTFSSGLFWLFMDIIGNAWGRVW